MLPDAPLIVSLANTKEVLYLVNRPGKAVSHSGSAGGTSGGMTVNSRGSITTEVDSAHGIYVVSQGGSGQGSGVGKGDSG